MARGIYREGFFKVSRRLLDSTLWCEDGDVIKVFMALLALAQDPGSSRDGTVLIARKQLAARCLMNEERLDACLGILSSPDPQSRTRADEGRRIEVLPNGFRVLNYGLYHDEAADKRLSQARARAGRIGGTQSGQVRRGKSDSPKQNRSKTEAKRSYGDGDKTETERETTNPLSPLGDLVAFYNRLTGRRLSAEAHRKAIAPRLAEKIPLVTMKLAVVGACLHHHYIGLNDRAHEYLDPETIFKPGRIDGHAERARHATFRLERAEEVWSYWRRRLNLGPAEVMEHFFRLRDELLIEEGSAPLGPAAVYSGMRADAEWPTREERA